MSKIPVQIKIIDTRWGTECPLPNHSTEGSAAIDLRAMIPAPYEIQPGATLEIEAGFAMQIMEESWHAIILPRSGLGNRDGIVIAGTVGLIDNDYRGGLKVVLWNRSSKAFTVKPLDRVCQMALIQCPQFDISIVDELGATGRGDGGFGHTGSA